MKERAGGIKKLEATVERVNRRFKVPCWIQQGLRMDATTLYFRPSQDQTPASGWFLLHLTFEEDPRRLRTQCHSGTRATAIS